ncbi:tetratricopeptide repeat protein [Anaeramoeba flamelloides]|uniref:Tetratricopeptide repeat protein n=1 Tax=Anaeramoeba flamelloides TaxID=1746091 RepID=A0ABQ8X8R8_9EUKA|nr:tetratricopeptide repeat protein [Anaeramoeba flamelloides]
MSNNLPKVTEILEETEKKEIKKKEKEIEKTKENDKQKQTTTKTKKTTTKTETKKKEKKQVNEKKTEKKEEEDLTLNHALFMDELPQNLGDNSELEAIQSLIYEDPPEERAENFKERGNEFFRLEPPRYKEALEYYTKAIRQNSKIDDNNAIYYTNSGLCNYKIGNLGTCVKECKTAIKFKPSHAKAWYWMISALFKLRKYEETIKYSKKRQEVITKPNKQIEKFVKLSIQKIEERKQRKKDQEIIEKHNNLEMKKFHRAIRRKKWRLGDVGYPAFGNFDPQRWFDPQTQEYHTSALFVYEEHSTVDFVRDFSENRTFGEVVREIFPRKAEKNPEKFPYWDAKREYVLEDIEIYWITNEMPVKVESQIHKIERNTKTKKFVKVNFKQKLSDILNNPLYVIPGYPVFYPVVKKSKFKKILLNKDL